MKERNDDEPDATLSPQSENAAKTLHWLLKSVSSLKSDVNQINRNINVTRAFQQSEEVQKKMHLLQVSRKTHFGVTPICSLSRRFKGRYQLIPPHLILLLYYNPKANFILPLFLS